MTAPAPAYSFRPTFPAQAARAAAAAVPAQHDRLSCPYHNGLVLTRNLSSITVRWTLMFAGLIASALLASGHLAVVGG